MNPILLKPEADSRSQVIVLGRPWRSLPAGSYYRRKEELWPIITAALDRLRDAYELVIIEGAGSPVELNLRSADMVNMAVAHHARAPVLLVGDIDRGGIFAQLLGTLWLLPPEERALVRGLVVNKFRGDPALFAEGVRILAERGGVPVLGVVPYLPALAIPEEDAVALEEGSRVRQNTGAAAPRSGERGYEGFGRSRSRLAALDITVIRLPYIANFDDFDPLLAEPGVGLRYIESPAELGTPHAVILPGTKSTLADLAWMRRQGFVKAIQDLASQGTAIVGICGGYQMLGKVIRDPGHVESADEEAAGLELLPVETTFEAVKVTEQVRARVVGGPGWLVAVAGLELTGYEIHMGRTTGGRPWLETASRGATSDDGRVWGSYLHGLFANTAFRRAWLASLALDGKGVEKVGAQTGTLSSALDRLADAVEAALDMQRLEAIIAEGNRQ